MAWVWFAYFGSLLLLGCGASIEPEPEPPSSSPMSCAVLEINTVGAPVLWQLVPLDSPNPLPGQCDDWKNGMWYCAASACLPSSYAGSCPRCL